MRVRRVGTGLGTRKPSGFGDPVGDTSTDRRRAESSCGRLMFPVCEPSAAFADLLRPTLRTSFGQLLRTRVGLRNVLFSFVIGFPYVNVRYLYKPEREIHRTAPNRCGNLYGKSQKDKILWIKNKGDVSVLLLHE